MRVTIIGTGYVGLTTAAALAHLGHHVTCVDVDSEKIGLLEAGGTPIYEPYLQAVLQANRARIRFTTDTVAAVAANQVVIVAVGTPSNSDGSVNLEYVTAAVRAISRGLTDSYKVIVNKSTVPIGTAEATLAMLQELAPSAHFGVASNPEFLRQGSAVRDSLYPDRIVVGSQDQRALNILEELYGPLIRQEFAEPAGVARPTGLRRVPFLRMDVQSAELAKYAANAFLAMKISFINEIANLAERLGADVGDVATVLAADPRIGGQHLKAGIGYGGSCFPKDTAGLYQLSASVGYDFKLVKATMEVNDQQWRWVPNHLQQILGTLHGKVVALLGLAFKPGTDDLREAPALAVAQYLLGQGAIVRAHDPVAGQKAVDLVSGMSVCDDPYSTVHGADAVVLLTEWPQYKSLDWDRVASLVNGKVLLDGRRYLEDEVATDMNMVVLGRRGRF